MFELFRRLRLPSLGCINCLGKATFMIYLIHDNGFAYSLWETQDWVTLLYEDFWGFMAKLGIWTLGVFVTGLVAYYLFVLGEKLLKKCKILFIKE